MPAELIATRFDALDRERFRDMVNSPPFAIFTKRIQAELERVQGTAERSDNVVEIRRAQGSINCLRMVLGLPNQILIDMQSKKGKP